MIRSCLTDHVVNSLSKKATCKKIRVKKRINASRQISSYVQMLFNESIKQKPDAFVCLYFCPENILEELFISND